MEYGQVLEELENLLSDTFDLWDHNRVGFQWKNYTWNHTMRVRGMSIELGRREGGDITKLEVAGTLHDITKRYDGEILTDENGKRVLDQNGFWLNESLKPNRGNFVTELYHANNLYGKVHHESGAFISKKILSMYDFEQGFVDAVSSIVLAHLKPTNLSKEDFHLLYRNIENQILYDADTIDPNVGFTAFFRNVHIHSYFALQRDGAFDLETYVEGLSRFVDTKQEFVGKLLTESARDIAEARQDRNRVLFAQILGELDDVVINRRYGLLGVIEYFVSETQDPDFANQLAYLQKNWVPDRRRWIAQEEPNQAARDRAETALNRVVDFTTLLAREQSGEI